MDYTIWSTRVYVQSSELSPPRPYPQESVAPPLGYNPFTSRTVCKSNMSVQSVNFLEFNDFLISSQQITKQKASPWIAIKNTPIFFKLCSLSYNTYSMIIKFFDLPAGKSYMIFCFFAILVFFPAFYVLQENLKSYSLATKLKK